MKGLTLFKRTRGEGGGSWLIASWHHPKSITWRWALAVRKTDFHIKPVTWNANNNSGFFLFLWFRFSWQQNMFVKNPASNTP